MKKQELKEKTAQVKTETKTALETILDNLNQGQRKKVLKVEAVKELCERYGITE
jgi:peptidyl-tRNA hydrolase